MRHVLTIETPSLGNRSYVVHDGQHALVIDPPRDIDRVLSVVDAAEVRVTHVAETHVHNDYVSGGLVLARRTGARYVHAASEDLRFPVEPMADGDRFTVGALTVEVVHTPGHTPHHLSYVVRADGHPPAAFTGGSLLYGSVGRTDLISREATEELTRAQFRSARRLVDELPDETELYPTHGFGSFCSSAKSEGESDGTLGGERRVNVAFDVDDEDRFVSTLMDGLTDYPRYYAHMGPLNLAGGTPVDLSPPVLVDPTELARRIHDGEWVIDLRQRRAFAADHVTGTIGIELDDPFSTYLGWLIPWGTPITLLGDSIDQVSEAQRQMVRIGLERPSGAAEGGIEQWGEGHDRRTYPVRDFSDLAEALAHGGARVLDVRRQDEHDERHVEGAHHVPLHELLDRLDDIDEGPWWVHCASGFRASIAASLLDRAGKSVTLIDADFTDADDAGVPLTEG